MNNFALYKSLYKLDNIKIKSIKNNTINFVLFDSKLKFYMICDNSIPSYSFDLNLGIIDLIKNIEQTYKIKILNYLPVCFVNGKSLLMACKISTNNSRYLKEISNDTYSDIIKIIKNKADYYSEEYDDESVLIEKYHRRYKIYNKYIKKVFLTEKKRRKKEFQSLISRLCGEYKSIIDVSCGDNLDIYRISNRENIIVCNDISLYQLRCCESRSNNVLFTNDNILDLSFKNNIFDVSYCKNTLHHMNNDEEIKALLNNMYNISNKLVIVEIEDPKKVGGVSKLLNKYLYMDYLKDAGKYFLSFCKFKRIIDNNFKDKCNISYLSFRNVLGNYMIAVVEKR
ncbi:MAG: class I SAM-dependent methyltransferase [Bacilli bacterium]|nr:class I SAM-dependent methyltransferase [Bacilli bacterium]